MKVWVLVDIGCIECGADNWSPVIGIYTNYEDAMVAIGVEDSRAKEWVAENARRGYDMSDRWSYEERDGTYGISFPDSQIRLQEVEL